MQAVDQPTRDRVCREVLEQGPVTASDLASTLGLTPAAVRRHLDGLESDGTVVVLTSSAAAEGAPRGRGRPARRYVLSDSGHSRMVAGYDDLAAAALEFLAEMAGPQAIEGFATARAARLTSRYRDEVEAAGPDPHARAEALAGALSADGYAATVRSVSEDGRQLCQGHCPVQHVAAKFPQLCEAETTAFSQLLGVHVQRLATLAHGEHVCTTHIPILHVTRNTVPSREKRADDHRVAS